MTPPSRSYDRLNRIATPVKPACPREPRRPRRVCLTRREVTLNSLICRMICEREARRRSGSAYAEVSSDPEVASTAAGGDDIAAAPSCAPNPERAGEVATVARDRCDRTFSTKCVSGEEPGDQKDRLSATATGAGERDRTSTMNR